MRRTYTEVKFHKKNMEKLKLVWKILDEFEGYNLTVRQVFYQFVQRNIVPNNQNEYGKISRLLKKARMGGLVDWDRIEDRQRIPYIPYSVRNLEHALSETHEQYRIDRQNGQEKYIELWTEKDALSGVLKPMTAHYHIHLVVCRGFHSCTAMHDAYHRMAEHENPYILYLGDHDPSGLFMDEDIKKRLVEFGIQPKIKRIGITKKQIEEYRLPSNPLKEKDPRKDRYIRETGAETSWEVDALKPPVLHQLIQENVESLIDVGLFKEQIEKEKQDKDKLKGYIDNLEMGDNNA